LFKRIVVGTDGSDTASQAVAKASELAKLAGAELNIVSAFEPVSKSRIASEQRDAPADVQYEISPSEDVNLTLEAAAAPARKEGTEVHIHPVQGDPSDAIINTAEKVDADLIVVGNKGMTGARRFILGSVPNNISHHAPCSVMIIHTT
jgi:nucleotide-binding universal stress UspA family protein